MATSRTEIRSNNLHGIVNRKDQKARLWVNENGVHFSLVVPFSQLEEIVDRSRAVNDLRDRMGK